MACVSLGFPKCKQAVKTAPHHMAVGGPEWTQHRARPRKASEGLEREPQEWQGEGVLVATGSACWRGHPAR